MALPGKNIKLYFTILACKKISLLNSKQEFNLKHKSNNLNNLINLNTLINKVLINRALNFIFSNFINS